MRTLYFYILRKFNDGNPSRSEVAYCLKKPHTLRIRYAMTHYIMGKSYEEIAKEMGCTRERIRQLLIKGCL